MSPDSTVQQATIQSRPKFSVSIAGTPNPSTLKFDFSEILTENSKEYLQAADTFDSPLASKLFGFPWTASVFLGPQFVSVSKQDWVEWEVLAEPLRSIIEEHINSNQALFIEMPVATLGDEAAENDPSWSLETLATVQKIKSVLKNEIRPIVALDGGDVLFAKFEDQILFLRMVGSCSGCPSSQATLKEGIEVRMKELVPEVLEVRSL